MVSPDKLNKLGGTVGYVGAPDIRPNTTYNPDIGVTQVCVCVCACVCVCVC